METEKKNLACQVPADVFDKLTQYCQMSRQSKTAVVEMALRKFLNENFERMQVFQDSMMGGDTV